MYSVFIVFREKFNKKSFRISCGSRKHNKELVPIIRRTLRDFSCYIVALKVVSRCCLFYHKKGNKILLQLQWWVEKTSNKFAQLIAQHCGASCRANRKMLVLFNLSHEVSLPIAKEKICCARGDNMNNSFQRIFLR